MSLNNVCESKGIPLEIENLIQEYIPTCNMCGKMWVELADHVESFYFKDHSPVPWLGSEQDIYRDSCRLTNIDIMPLDKAFTGDFMDAYLEYECSSRTIFHKYHNRRYIPQTIDCFTFDFRTLCDDCEYDMTIKSGFFLLAYCEKLCENNLATVGLSLTPRINITAVKRVYNGDETNYCSIREKRFFDYFGDVCLYDVFEESSGFDGEGDLMEQLMNGYGYHLFPIMYTRWNVYLSMIEHLMDVDSDASDDLLLPSDDDDDIWLGNESDTESEPDREDL